MQKKGIYIFSSVYVFSYKLKLLLSVVLNAQKVRYNTHINMTNDPPVKPNRSIAAPKTGETIAPPAIAVISKPEI